MTRLIVAVLVIALAIIGGTAWQIRELQNELTDVRSQLGDSADMASRIDDLEADIADDSSASYELSTIRMDDLESRIEDIDSRIDDCVHEIEYTLEFSLDLPFISC